MLEGAGLPRHKPNVAATSRLKRHIGSFASVSLRCSQGLRRNKEPEVKAPSRRPPSLGPGLSAP
jgi:hypothetical protein